LIQLIAEAKQAFYEDKLTVAHAFEIARLQPNDQRRALQECFPQYRNAAAILKDKKAEATTVRELHAWIEREIHLDSQTHRLTRRTKHFCQRPERALVARNERAATRFSFPKSVRSPFVC
jgi:hypothetical protein